MKIFPTHNGLKMMLLSLALWAACSTPPPEQALVIEHLARQNGLEPGQIEIIQWNEPVPVLGRDSLALLEQQFEKERARKLEHLHKAIASAEKAIQHAEEGKKGGYASLAPIFDETIEKSQRQLEEAQAIINALENNCQQTSLAELCTAIEHYRSVADSTLGYKLKGAAMLEAEGQTRRADFHFFANRSQMKILHALPAANGSRPSR